MKTAMITLARRAATSLASAAIAVTLAVSVTAAQSVTAIVNGRVIDGHGGPPIARGVVLIEGNRITAVGPATTVAIPVGARIIDARGNSVLQGLADMHVHLLGGWDGETSDLLGYQRYLNALLYSGVTTVLDAGNSLPFIQQLRREQSAGRIAGPTIFMVGPLLDGANASWQFVSFAISSPAQIPRFVKQLKGAGVDAVKAYGGLTPEQISDLVKAASAESLPVFADVWLRNGTAAVATLGISAFAHLGTVPVTDETIAVMRDSAIATVTALSVEESFSRRRLRDLRFLTEPLVANTMPPWFIADLTTFAAQNTRATDSAATARAEYRLRNAMSNAKRLADAGMMLVAGTDAPYPGAFYGEALHRELELLVEAGLTPLQALTAATRNAARLMKQSAQWGTLEPGRRADVLIVRGDPSKRIGDTRNIEMVLQSGRVIDRDALRFDASRDPGFRTNPKAPPR